ncbi:chaplin [Streptomyces sp. NPDC019443]|uniref:chaplin n=1 Tax=Streptomyces sp. NPDC019443 TaxID=3365061 RepID=UPI0037AB3225
MRQVTRKGLITMAAAGGVLALGGSYAYADAGATGNASNSPGVASGNSVQLPVHIPVNACGNTVNVVGLLNPAGGNGCANTSGSDNGSPGGGAQAGGETSDSPGIASGNTIQAPVHVPVNACGNTVDVVGLLNPVSGNECGNMSDGGSPGTGAQAGGDTSASPGIASGNLIQAPVHVPVDACGNAVTIGGLGNAVSGNDCGNGTTPGTETPPGPPVTPPGPPVTPPGTPVTPPGPPVTPPGTPVTPPGTVTPPVTPGQPETPAQPAEPTTPNAPQPVAPNSPGTQTGTSPGTTDELAQTGSGPLDTLIPAGAGLLLAGAVLYRRGRARA